MQKKDKENMKKMEKKEVYKKSKKYILKKLGATAKSTPSMRT